MPEPLAKLPSAGLMTLAGLTLGGLVGARYLGTRKVSSAEQLADALLETEALREAALTEIGRPDLRLAGCVNYLLAVAQRSAGGYGFATGANDPEGYSRSQTHRYTQATAQVVTESHAPNHALTYSVTIPEAGSVRGTRSHATLQMNGILPVYPITETVQITFNDGYVAQAESDMKMTEGFLTGNARQFGTITVRDGYGNVGRLHISTDGVINGTIMRGSQIAGRFQGRLGSGVNFHPYQSNFHPYQLEPGAS